MLDVEKRSFRKGVAPHDAAVLNAPGQFANPLSMNIPAQVGVSITAVATSDLFQNITITGIPGTGPLSFIGSGEGLMPLAGTGAIFAAPPTLSETYFMSVLFQFSDVEGGQLVNGVIGIEPEEAFGTAGDVALVAIASQDESAKDPNGALALITLTNIF